MKEGKMMSEVLSQSQIDALLSSFSAEGTKRLKI